jgi:DNA-binding transcriptional regulator YiaG
VSLGIRDNVLGYSDHGDPVAYQDEGMDTAHAIRKAIAEIRASDVPLPPPEIRRARRVGAGLTQKRLAEPLGVSRVAVSRYETGAREPRGEIRRRYAEALEAIHGD